jgi:Copper transport outer membrane protein, MctB
LINFRYHIVSLMAVFIALSVGIAVGVSLSPSVDQGLLQQAAQDRKQVADLRTELDRRKALDNYRNAYDEQVGTAVTAGVMNGQRVAMVAMPDAPADVLRTISNAVVEAGGTVVRDVKVNAEAFDPTKTENVTEALSGYVGPLGLSDAMSPATRLGVALGRSIGSKDAEDRDALAIAVGESLEKRGLVTISKDSASQAQLIVVVTAPATEPRPTPEQLNAHVQFDVGLTNRAGVVLAGPNSEEIEGTDVLAARSDATAVDSLSTVDVADLSSGVTTVVLAGKERLLGRPPQHYGALAKADAPLPDLPVR